MLPPANEREPTELTTRMGNVTYGEQEGGKAAPQLLHIQNGKRGDRRDSRIMHRNFSWRQNGPDVESGRKKRGELPYLSSL